MARVLRGEVYWADLEPIRGHEQGGRRPVLVLSHELFNSRSETVIVMALTSQPRRVGYPLTWQLPPNTLPRQSWVKISQVRTIFTDRLGDRLGQLSERDLDDIVGGLLQLIG